ncbi:hypothetical protein LTS18_009326 [Coniosporium uncinatum]|uniref:Uncharacterized protein n=1 Tax=Coniosporium uncinatum TaxID=93489 RepID=A0ACC3DM98_9PEZI|nr:hypothetical protein LTS18_009326 [Coniosporium uncinatum]
MAPTPQPPHLGAVGIGVSSMEQSLAFYTTVLGLAVTSTVDVAPWYEKVLSWPNDSSGGPSIVLMYYKSGKSPRNQTGKLVFYVDDVKATMQKLRTEGKRYGVKVVMDSFTGEGMGTGAAGFEAIGMVKDPDGFVLEFLPRGALRSKI